MSAAPMSSEPGRGRDNKRSPSPARDYSGSGDSPANDSKPDLLSALRIGPLSALHQEEVRADSRRSLSDSVSSMVNRMSQKLPEYVSEAKESVTAKNRLSFIDAAAKLWSLWEKFTNIASSPWNSVIKYGLPVAAATAGLVFYQGAVQIGLEVLKATASLAAPCVTAALFLVPVVSAGKLWDVGVKFLRIEPIAEWKKQAILKPVQAGLLVGAAIWAQTMHLNMLTYGAWAGAAVGIGYLAMKVASLPPRKVLIATALALALPWGHLATMRSYDVTVLSAGPDPEVAAWNIGTDLSVKNHWKGIFGMSADSSLSGKSGMVLINRDVPLFVPPHRTANAFNADFSTLIGKQVRVTTIGGWMKFISPNLQPTIVRYEVLNNSMPVTLPGQ